MFAEEFNLASQESSSLMNNYNDDDDASGRLSFCDLPLNAKICDWNPSKEVYKNSPSDQDVFEFITTKDLFTGYAKDNIIFCGKLIPYKTPKLDNTISNNQKKSKSKNRAGEAKKDHNSDVSILASTRVKSSRWYMLAFGMRSFQMGKMDLSDIKARQTRRNNSMKKVVASQSHNVLGGIDQMSVKTDGKNTRKSGLWGLLRLLGCKGLHQNANTIVKYSSTGCIPKV